MRPFKTFLLLLTLFCSGCGTHSTTIGGTYSFFISYEYDQKTNIIVSKKEKTMLNSNLFKIDNPIVAGDRITIRVINGRFSYDEEADKVMIVGKKYTVDSIKYEYAEIDEVQKDQLTTNTARDNQIPYKIADKYVVNKDRTFIELDKYQGPLFASVGSHGRYAEEWNGGIYQKCRVSALYSYRPR